MNKKLGTVLALTLAQVVATSAGAADMVGRDNAPVYVDRGARDGVKIGMLTCDVGGGVGYVIGSAKSVDCVFKASNGEQDVYSGVIRKMGVDLGFTTQGRIVWAVFAPTAGYHQGSLGGLYQGATAEATVGVGVGTNILVGGTSGSIQLQTISVSGQLGLNLAATGTSVTLQPQG
ncbi:DUF992 domain-containing protein [Shinella sumterensis]|jgi:hypothetical protein|uniref:DUF992 domain-containing protein n=1 Tax=Shinella oryzae TaxID=2871820 RepID=A0ABY9K0W2_9HYPH|nr:DUF992 domain-containing protein [Shinella oryzae]WLS02217.1 DUF992 domain-containing protein [Shinella oryzae]WLS08525.1 DUF992 domain-containing protein [Shinella sumterensis]